MTSRIKILGRMDVVEKRRPQDGRIKTRGPTAGGRAASVDAAHGLRREAGDADLRSGRAARDFRELGFGDEDRSLGTRWSRSPGIVLVTGPTGSGKTTTLYTTLKQLATPEVNVCTVEDPIEMVEPAFNQMQVSTASSSSSPTASGR
jgi:general secretion pathway protein E